MSSRRTMKKGQVYLNLTPESFKASVRSRQLVSTVLTSQGDVGMSTWLIVSVCQWRKFSNFERQFQCDTFGNFA